LIPITVRPPNLLNLATTLPTVRMVVEVSKAAAVLSTAVIVRVLRSKVRLTAWARARARARARVTVRFRARVTVMLGFYLVLIMITIF